MHSDDGQTHRTKTDAIADLPQSSTNALRVADQIKGGTGNAMKPKGDTEGTISQNTK